jgi:predicted transcriptional regulator/uncharacterized protein YbaR (Trm112 family)
LKRHLLAKNQVLLDSFQGEDVAEYVSKLTDTKLKIIQLLDEGYYAAAIARRLNKSRSYCSKFISELRFRGLISVEWINPLTRRAVSYRVMPELKTYLLHMQKPTTNFSLFPPHKIRYNYPLLDKTKPVSVSTGRFAAAKVKHQKTWCMQGGNWHFFSMRHERAGNIGITVHGQSIEVYQRERHPIPSASLEDATNQVAIAINDVAQRFVQEQGWESVNFSLGQPVLVGSPHYAGPSKLARQVTDAGQTLLPLVAGGEIDKSLEKKYKDKDVADIEYYDIDAATIIDQGLKNAYNIDKIVPNLVRDELRSVSESITGINAQSEKIDALCNNVAALCQSGLPLQNQFNQIQTVVARQGESIHLIQESMLKIIENMGKILDKLGGQ